jgi:hypothetical protein
MKRMFGIKRATAGSFLAFLLAGIPAISQQPQSNAQQQKVKIFNTAKLKLMEGKQIFSYTISRPDPALYCEVAPHYDFIWLEMQHSTQTWADLEKMIATCPGVVFPWCACRTNTRAPSRKPPTSEPWESSSRPWIR